MFESVGFNDIEARELYYNLSAAPPIFYIDDQITNLGESEREEARESYRKAHKMIREHGESSPPTILVKDTK